MSSTPRPAAAPADQAGTAVPSPHLVVAVDGTSGSGKSSTSRGVADRLGLRYLDTGAMFRAMTWWLLREGIDVRDTAAVAANADRPRIASGTDPLAPAITVDGVDVSVEIRGEEVTAAAWRIAFDAGVYCNAVAYPAVPRGRGVLRLSVMATHTSEQLHLAAEVVGSAVEQARTMVADDPAPASAAVA